MIATHSIPPNFKKELIKDNKKAIEDNIYIRFPIFLLRGLLEDPFLKFQYILAHGIGYYSELKGISIEEVSKMFSYLNKRGKSCHLKPEWVREVLDIQKSTIPERDPMPMVNIKHIINFISHDKFNDEIVQLLAFISVGSILGKKAIALTNDKLLISRMLGYNKYDSMISNISEFEKRFYEKYSKEYHSKKLRENLSLNWNLLTYSKRGVRGYYIGLRNKTTLYDIVKKVIDKKEAKAKLKTEKEEAEKRAGLNILKTKIQPTKLKTIDENNRFSKLEDNLLPAPAGSLSNTTNDFSQEINSFEYKTNQIRDSKAWVEQIAMKFKTNELQVFNAMEEFFSEVEIKEKTNLSLKELKEYFFNWLNRKHIEKSNSSRINLSDRDKRKQGTDNLALIALSILNNKNTHK